MMLTPHSWLFTTNHQKRTGVSCHTDAQEYDDAVEFTPAPVAPPSLLLSGHATDHIWAMGEANEEISLRMDCGDSGYVTLSKEQALGVIGTLQQILGPDMPRPTEKLNFFERVDDWFNRHGW